MIIDLTRGDIFKTPYRRILFAVNTSGDNCEGFAGVVAHKYWPELQNTGRKELGTILTKTVSGMTFHAAVCHVDVQVGGWKRTPEILGEVLRKLEPGDGSAIAAVLIGGGIIGQETGADVLEILGVFARSKTKVAVYRR